MDEPGPKYNVLAIMDAYVRAIGIPRHWLRTEKELAAFRKRSAAARKGWVTRKLQAS